MLSEFLVVMSLMVSAPPTSDAGTANGVSADTVETPTAPSGPVCSADSRRERRAAAARELRLHREALKVTRETLAHANQILAARTDGVVERWQAEFRTTARERLDSTRKRDRAKQRLPTPALCKALAARDLQACRALKDDDERGPCQVWATVISRERSEPKSCSALPEPAKSICVLAETGDEKTCEVAPDEHRGICESAAQALRGGEAGCSAPFHAQRCTWALLVGALGATKTPCESQAKRGEGLRRAMQFCRSAQAGTPAECPGDERPAWATQEGTKTLQREEAFRIEDGQEGLVAWVSLMTSAPAACAVSVSADDGAEASFGAAILSTLDDVLISVGPLSPSGGARSLKTVCAPTFDWRAGATP